MKDLKTLVSEAEKHVNRLRPSEQKRLLLMLLQAVSGEKKIPREEISWIELAWDRIEIDNLHLYPMRAARLWDAVLYDLESYPTGERIDEIRFLLSALIDLHLQERRYHQ